MEANLLLEIKDLSKSFGENLVLKDLNLRLDQGEILGLVGENGAGKSTLMNIIFGMEFIKDTGGYDGDIYFDGQRVEFSNPTQALEAGIGMVHQEFSLIPGFTVAENISLNMEETKKNPVSKVLGKNYELIDKKANIEDSEKLLERLGVDINPVDYVSELPVGHKQFIEIAREIKRDDVKLLIMDEPTAVLTESEADILISALRSLADRGISIIFISHRLREILNVSDRVIVLRDGNLVEDLPAASLNVKDLAKMMMGDNGSRAYKDLTDRNLDDEDIIFSLRNLYVEMPGEMVYDVNLDVRKGEILGIAGLAGQGKLGIANGILGTYPVSGKAVFKGEELKLSDTKKILEKRIAFVSEDRRGVGLLLSENIALNIAFNAMEVFNLFTKEIFKLSFRDEKAMVENANSYMQSLAIKAQGPYDLVGRLSGGNQQKVCLAKALTMDPELLFVSEPTRGIDIGAKSLVLDSLRKVNRENMTTIVMVSSELEELKSICDRIAVVCEGKITGILDPTASAEDFGLLMSGEVLSHE